MPLQKLFHRRGICFLLFWLFVLVLYFPSYKGGFHNDFMGFLVAYQKLSFKDYLMLTPSSLYQGVNLAHYVFISLFGTHPVPWLLLFTALHALNATLIARFFQRFLNLSNENEHDAACVALSTALIWLISPIQAEVLTWKACVHYLLSVGMIFVILNWLMRYLLSGQKKHLFFIPLLYYISTFFLEYFYLTPVLVLVLLLSLTGSGAIERARLKRLILTIVLPLLAIWCMYWVTLWAITSRAVGRIETSHETLSIAMNMAKFLKFLAHVYFMEYYLPSAKKAMLYQWLHSDVVILVASCSLLALLVFGCVRFGHLKARSRSLLTVGSLGLISCASILPLWFYDLFPYEGSRYYYLPSVFLYALLPLSFLRPGKKNVSGKIFLGLYGLCCVASTLYLNVQTGRSGTIFRNIIKNFKWEKAERVLLLDLPQTYNGVGVIGADKANNFKLHLNIFRKKDTITARIYDVSSYNMMGRWDGAHVTVLDSTTLKVTLNQYGSWWWYDGFGASDYENDTYSVTMIDNGFSYLLKMKQKPDKDIVLLYLVGDEWKEVDMSRIGEEQW